MNVAVSLSEIIKDKFMVMGVIYVTDGKQQI
jgi:hypothetical protein